MAESEAEPLGGAVGLLETMSFKEATESVCRGKLRMLEGSEFQTVGAAMLKPREAKVVRTHGTYRRLVLAERRERVGV